jgi:hypothetical protein
MMLRTCTPDHSPPLGVSDPAPVDSPRHRLMACHIVCLQLADELQQPGGEPVGIDPVAIGTDVRGSPSAPSWSTCT